MENSQKLVAGQISIRTIRQWYLPILGLLCIVILALSFRVYNLTDLPVFVDEAIYIRWAQIMRAEPTLRFLPLSDGKQPLFMWIVIPFLKLLSDPLFAGRLVSVFAGIGTLLGVFTFTYILFASKRTSLIAALIYAIAPYTVFFDRLALVDSLLSFFGIWTFIFSILSARYLRLDMAMFAGFALGGALLTKSPSLFFALLLPVSLLIVDWPKKKTSVIITIGKLFVLWLVTWGIGYGMQNIMRLGPGFSNLFSRNLDYVHPITQPLVSPFDPLMPHTDRAIEWLLALGPWPLIILIVLALLVNIRRFPRRLLLLSAWGILPILIQAEYAKVFTARYIYFSLPILIVLATSAFLVLEYPTKIKYLMRYKKLMVKLAPLVLTLYCLHATLVSFTLVNSPEAAPLPRSERSGYLEDWTAGGGIRETAEILKDIHRDNPGIPIVVGTEGYFGTLPDGLQIYLEKMPNVTVIGIGIDLHIVPQSLLDSYAAGNKTFLVINSSRLKMQEPYEQFGLKTLYSYQKPMRPVDAEKYKENGPFDTLYLFELQ